MKNRKVKESTKGSPEIIRDRIKSFRRVKASLLRPSPKNWRTHPKAQRDALRGILTEIGYADVLLTRELPDSSFELIDGHLRAEMTPDMEVPVLVLDVTEEEAGKLLASLDPLAAMAQADKEKLAALLRQVETGSDPLRQMLQDLASSNGLEGLLPGLADPDEVPERPDEPITRPGDLWVLGNHRLLCGDSSKPEDVDRLLDGASVHSVVTDPPYGVSLEPRSNNAIASGLSSFTAKHHQRFDVNRHPEKCKPTGNKMRAKDRPLANDFLSEDAFKEKLKAWFGNMARVLLPGRPFFIWGGYSNIANYPHALEASGLYFSQQIIWHKMHPVLTRKCFMGDHEWCFFGWREGAAHQFFGPKNISDVWAVKKINPLAMTHLTEKPCELSARAIQYSSRIGENVLDLFGGSGSTLIAAEGTDRRAFLMEIDPAYCDVIVTRWETFTGKKAKPRLMRTR
jgi:DNA modification methylase